MLKPVDIGNGRKLSIHFAYSKFTYRGKPLEATTCSLLMFTQGSDESTTILEAKVKQWHDDRPDRNISRDSAFKALKDLMLEEMENAYASRITREAYGKLCANYYNRKGNKNAAA